MLLSVIIWESSKVVVMTWSLSGLFCCILCAENFPGKDSMPRPRRKNTTELWNAKSKFAFHFCSTVELVRLSVRRSAERTAGVHELLPEPQLRPKTGLPVFAGIISACSWKECTSRNGGLWLELAQWWEIWLDGPFDSEEHLSFARHGERFGWKFAAGFAVSRAANLSGGI